jgi:phosphoribosylaminoimidazolecarboxamide formyltransferase/IMP cyclohydrolase
VIVKALISVYDKTGVVGFARQLNQAGVELVSTGGTYRTLIDEGKCPVQKVSDLTKYPEILEGRVKTLHPTIHGGILARRDKTAHLNELDSHNIEPIDIVVNNLYPFEETIQIPEITLEDALENIDIGGPAMLRASAKNFPHVLVIVDPTDYDWIGQRLIEGKSFSEQERRQLAWKAFQHTALYDTVIATYLRGTEELFPQELTLGYRLRSPLRYGENPHQPAALYTQVPAAGGIPWAMQIHGKELSFNNLLDAHAAWRTVTAFTECTVAIIKHNNPCGLATNINQSEAYRKALSGDPISAYGGIVSFNQTVTTEVAIAMGDVFYEVVIAPDYDSEALEILRKKKNLRLLQIAHMNGDLTQMEHRDVAGGVLRQSLDQVSETPHDWKVVTNIHPTQRQLEDLVFAWKAAKHVKSNAIVLAKDSALVGMGAGQPNRVVSIHLAIRAAGERARSSVLASDAFFPFADNVEEAAEGGIAAIVQPGGSIRDDESIEAANRLGIAMVFTNVRHFRH